MTTDSLFSYFSASNNWSDMGLSFDCWRSADGETEVAYFEDCWSISTADGYDYDDLDAESVANILDISIDDIAAILSF